MNSSGIWNFPKGHTPSNLHSSALQCNATQNSQVLSIAVQFSAKAVELSLQQLLVSHILLTLWSICQHLV